MGHLTVTLKTIWRSNVFLMVNHIFDTGNEKDAQSKYDLKLEIGRPN